MGTRLFARMRRHTSSPSMPGIITSSSTTSNRSASSAESPRCPSGAPVTENPFCSRYVVKSSCSLLSSSMSRTRGMVLLGRGGFGLRGLGLGGRLVGRSAPAVVMMIAPAVVTVTVVVVAVVVAHRVEGETVSKNGSESQKSDCESSSHGVLLSAVRGPAALEHVTHHFALTVVEHAVDFADRFGCRAAERLRGDFDAPVGGAERRLVERSLAERSRHVAARFAQRAAELLRRVLELVKRAHDRPLLRRRGVDL